jgi:hypothetical protein
MGQRERDPLWPESYPCSPLGLRLPRDKHRLDERREPEFKASQVLYLEDSFHMQGLPSSHHGRVLENSKLWRIPHLMPSFRVRCHSSGPVYRGH